MGWDRERQREYMREYAKRPGVRERRNAQARSYRNRPETKERAQKKYKEYREDNCIWQKRYRDKNKEKLIAYNKKYREGFKKKVLDHYGAKCSCCGDAHIEFLSVDHIGGGGARHRKEIGSGGLYRWLVNNNFPPGFRILCFNCNLSRGHFGYCPHERESEIAQAI